MGINRVQYFEPLNMGSLQLCDVSKFVSGAAQKACRGELREGFVKPIELCVEGHLVALQQLKAEFAAGGEKSKSVDPVAWGILHRERLNSPCVQGIVHTASQTENVWPTRPNYPARSMPEGWNRGFEGDGFAESSRWKGSGATPSHQGAAHANFTPNEEPQPTNDRHDHLSQVQKTPRGDGGDRAWKWQRARSVSALNRHSALHLNGGKRQTRVVTEKRGEDDDQLRNSRLSLVEPLQTSPSLVINSLVQNETSSRDAMGIPLVDLPRKASGDWKARLHPGEGMAREEIVAVGQVEGESEMRRKHRKGDAGRPALASTIADGGRSNVHAYNTLLQAAVRVGDTDKAMRLFNDMITNAVEPVNITYNILMPGLTRNGQLAQAAAVLKHMQKQGLRAVLPYNCLLGAYARGGQLQEILELMADMESGGVPKNQWTYITCMHALSKGKLVEPAVSLFKQMKEQKGIAVGVIAYTVMITVTSRAGLAKESIAYFREMKAAGIQADVTAYNSIIVTMGIAGETREALALYREMIACGLQPSLQTYVAMVNLYGRAEKLRDVARVLAEVRLSGCAPAQSLFGAALQACCRWASPGIDVGLVLQEMKVLGWQPSATALNSLASRFAKKGAVVPPELLTMLEEFMDRGGQLSEWTWFAMIRHHGDSGNHGKAIQLFKQMRHLGIRASKQTYSAALRAFGKAGMDGLAIDVALEAKPGGSNAFDLVCYNTILNSLAEQGQVSDAEKLLEDMKAAGVAPDVCSYTILIKAFGKLARVDDALRIYWHLNGLRCPFDEAAFNTIINVCGKKLPLEETIRLYRDMKRAQIRPSRTTSNVVINLLGRAGRFDDAAEVLNDMRSRGEADAVSFSTLVAAHGRRQQRQRMEETVADAIAAGVTPSREAYNAMIDTYGKAGRLALMEQALVRLRAMGHSPNLQSFNSLLYGYGRAGMLTEMEEVVERIRTAGLQPDVWTYNTLIGAYGAAEMPYASVKVVKRMQDDGLQPDEVTYKNLIATFTRAGDLLEAARWSIWMKQAGF